MDYDKWGIILADDIQIQKIYSKNFDITDINKEELKAYFHEYFTKGNLDIEGENLKFLKLVQETYYHKVN